MKYRSFEIENYRAIENRLIIDLSKTRLVPIVGINECGKTTILQAIYCFDYTNDKEYGGKHLKDTKNLYKTAEKGDPIITASIEIKYAKLVEIFDQTIKVLTEEQAEEDDENLEDDSTEISKQLNEGNKSTLVFPIGKKDYSGFIKIARNLQDKTYKLLDIEKVEGLRPEIHQEICENIIAELPYILYNDDFMDRPTTQVHIPIVKPARLTDWLSIYERLFNETDPAYSLFALVSEADQRRRSGILSDVKNLINKTLSRTWKTFLLSSHEAIDIDLQLIPYTGPEKTKYNNTLDIRIVEKINSKDRYFDVMDRSKGFIWYFNFVMKIQFNPKMNTVKNDNIYLLDEPGSYLHYSAQEKLCTKIVEISEKHGVVIYCTHSHTLLNPEHIPLNSIYIVEKNKHKQITATPLPSVKTKVENSTAYQPIHEALQISVFDLNVPNHPVLAVEGIYDKYAIELFTKTNNKLIIIPGTSADSIVKNIQFLNGYGKHYIAIWDNDNEGRDKYQLASKLYGEFESRKFDKLPLNGKHNRKMEDMFENGDIDLIKGLLGLPEEASYERAISELYFTKRERKRKIVDSISAKTMNNFEILDSIISKRLKESEKVLTLDL